MTDHKLNEAMALLCGFPSRPKAATYGPCAKPCTEPFICGGQLFRPSSDRRAHEAWNPANDWRQVHDFVIPALQRADCIVELEYDESGLYMEIKPACGGWIASGAVISLEPPPRSFCEIALEAVKKLEEMT